jgi:predicted phage tail protein
MLTKIILKGNLGEKFGEEFNASVENPKEVIDFLSSQFPNFKNFVLSQRESQYKITCVGENWEKELLPQTPNFQLFPISGKTIIIEEVFEGSGDGFMRFFSPILLIGVGIITGNTALIVGGIVQGLQSILFGYPPKPTEEKRSVNFQGGSPRTQEGTPIPIAIGSQVRIKDVMILSYDIESEYTSDGGGVSIGRGK